MKMTEFWRSAGTHLVSVNADGWLDVTPDLVRAYFARPEVRPIDTSCDQEIRLFEDLMANPMMTVDDARLATIDDADAADNYRTVLDFRARLVEAGTIEGAYLSMMRKADARVPSIFLDQMVHLIVHNILGKATDPIRLRAGEIFFREQNVSTDEGRIMLADEEVIAMHAETGGAGALGQLLVSSDTPMRQIELDVLDEDNKAMYWERSDNFDTVVDFRFTQPALDAFARVIEAWILHFLDLKVKVQPRRSIEDEHWSWHIGLDAEATRILNALYREETVEPQDAERLVALFQMDIEDQHRVGPTMSGKPIYLGLAMTEDKSVQMKPQNLLTNLPIIEPA